MSALIVHTAFLGDLCLSIPLMKKIKAEGVSLTLVSRKGLGSFFLELGLIDQFFEVTKGDASSYQKALNALKQRTFAEVYVPHESLRTAFFIKSLQASHKISYRSWWNFLFYDVRIRRDFKKPEALRVLELYRKDPFILEQISNYREVFSGKDQVLDPVPDWAQVQCQLPAISSQLHSIVPSAPFICVFPGSVWETKKWTEEGFQKFCLSWKGQIFLMGSPAEKELCEKIKGGLSHVQNMAGKFSLIETVQVLSRAQVCLSNDSGGQHLAAVAGTPVVTVFGPTVLEFGFRPWSQKSAVVQYEGLSCRPCGKHGHKKCPLGTHDCMKRITPEQVEKLVLELSSYSPRG
ncbi:MAG: glycosyltransferase family 9 protein [Proteobacteria bacterium]|jgi:heptosyltransferase-2|nr:glycosyltransferase family 9 protein [Pseudomonadota bacterium]